MMHPVLRYSTVVAALLLATPSVRAQQQDVLVKGGWYLNSANGTMERNTGILARAGVFLEIGANAAQLAQNARVVELKDDDYILPGLFDMHAHYNVDVLGKGRVDETSYIPLIYLANGVTSTWPGGEYDPEDMLELRKRIDRGEQVGPRIFSSGPYFGSARPGWDRNMTAEQVYRDVDYWTERGVRRFKAKGINPVQLRALIERAHLHGATVSGHLGSGLGNTVNAKDAVLMGIDGIEHILGGDVLDPNIDAYRGYLNLKIPSAEFTDIVDLFKKHNVVYSPTMTAVRRSTQKREVFDYWVDERKFFTPYIQELVAANPRARPFGLMDSLFDVKMTEIKAFHEAGGTIVASTDVQAVGTHIAGFNLHRELQTFVEAGIPPAAAIRAATLNAAKALGMDAKLGSIERGKFADLLVVKGNPLQDIRNTHKVQLVMKSGFLYDPAAILKSVEGKIGPVGPADAPKWMRAQPATS
jgi:imidazolonepropionase-like amidohydrolase